MLVSILVLFFRRRLIPSMPMPGEPRALGLDRDWSDVRVSAQTAPTQKEGRRGKGKALQGIPVQAITAFPLFSGGFRDKPASLSHFSSNGFSLHMFLKLRFKASKREMVVWLKSFPYSFPMARPTSPW